mmetsp:Transcript_87690/g.175419  ORF Transcript_87690/g.175419 Transcript_87690/m.175419 type:complete len:275 (-) Transcript_87690:233-1057(-)
MAFVRSFARAFPRSKQPKGIASKLKKSTSLTPPSPVVQPVADPTSWSWGWTPPAHTKPSQDPRTGLGGTTGEEEYEIPVKLGKLLESDEVVRLLESNGALDIKVIKIPDSRLDNIDEMVLATGRAATHLRRLAIMVVGALKKRGLSETIAPGVTGAEGQDCDDWMIVDCGNFAVQLMDAHTRRSLNLEEHWKNLNAVIVPHAGTAEEREDRIDSMTAAMPVPDDYNVGTQSEFESMAKKFGVDQREFSQTGEGEGAKEKDLGGSRGERGRRWKA